MTAAVIERPQVEPKLQTDGAGGPRKPRRPVTTGSDGEDDAGEWTVEVQRIKQG